MQEARQNGFSVLIVRLAIAAVCLSILVMILAVTISKGYQYQVRNKLTGFNAHIQINHLDLNNSLQSLPITRDTLFENLIVKQPNITHLQVFTTKAGIIKTDEAFEGIVLKGVDQHYNWNFIKSNLAQGVLLNLNDTQNTNEILISSNTADKLGFKLNDDVFIYFIQEPPRVRRLKIVGIFNSGLSELDELFAFTDIKTTQRLQNFGSNQITGYEIFAPSFYHLPNALNQVQQYAPVTMGINTIYQIYPQMFDWLNLLDLNVLIIIILMVVVATINMVTALLILIIERSNMIGIFKALGSSNKQIQNIFIYIAANIVIKGLLLGNFLGIGIALLQKNYGFLKLNPNDYYLKVVPIELQLTDILWINLVAFLICIFTLLIPVKIVSKIKPIKSIKFN